MTNKIKVTAKDEKQAIINASKQLNIDESKLKVSLIKEGKKIFTLEVCVDRQEFTEKKAVREQAAEADNSKTAETGAAPSQFAQEEYFMTIGPEMGLEEENAPEENYMEFGAEMY